MTSSKSCVILEQWICQPPEWKGCVQRTKVSQQLAHESGVPAWKGSGWLKNSAPFKQNGKPTSLLCFAFPTNALHTKKKKNQSLPHLKMKEKILAGRKWLHYFCPYIYIFIIGGLPLCFLYKSWYLVGWNREANCKRIQENFLHNTHLLPVLHCSDHNSCFAPGLISLWAKQTISPLCVRGTSGVGASCLRNISIGVPPLLSPIPVFLRDYSLEL